MLSGANIGMTITAWMVSLNQLGDAFTGTPARIFAPLCIGIGAISDCIFKETKIIWIGEIIQASTPFVALNL